MTDPDPPRWVSKRDGRLEPFDPDRISRALFAATETLGRPDAFLARELADGVVHFLTVDGEGQTPTTARVAEVVAQVVRELRHPDLARAFADHGRRRQRPAASAAGFRTAAGFTRDLEAAREAGLLVLPATEPGLLSAGVLGPPAGDLAADLHSLRRLVGRAAAIDGLEARAAGMTCHDLAGELAGALAQTRLEATANLNLPPPSWAAPVAAGPLFTAEPAVDAEQLRRLAEGLLDECLALGSAGLRIDWHLGASDFAPEGTGRLRGVLARAVAGAGVSFVFDRPRRPLALGPGLDRRHPAVLLEVGLNLPALASQPGLLAQPERFLQRLGTLARLALSAATQRRDQVRHGAGAPALTSGFLLDRARLVVVPVGLDEVVRQFTGWGMCSGGDSLEFGRSVLRRLRAALEHDGRLAQMECCLDGPAEFALGRGGEARARESVAGLTPWDPAASLRSQAQAGAALHAVGEAGTLALFVPAETSANELGAAVESLWRQTAVVRVRLMRGG